MDATSSTETMRDAALELAQWFDIIPVHRRTKLPHIKQWPEAATHDHETIASWFDRWPDANIGAVLHNGLIVLDIDDHICEDDENVDGNETRRKWERKHGDLPETVTSITGGGGMHLIYRTDRTIKEVNGCAVTGIDVLTGNRFIVLPPSVHYTGKPYAWETSPNEAPIAPVDDQILAFIEYIKQQVNKAHGTGKSRRDRKSSNTKKAERFELPAIIEQGSRNDTLASYAGSLWARGESAEDVRINVHIANRVRCADPLEDDEVDKIVDSILSYPSGHSPEFDAAMRGDTE